MQVSGFHAAPGSNAPSAAPSLRAAVDAAQERPGPATAHPPTTGAAHGDAAELSARAQAALAAEATEAALVRAPEDAASPDATAHERGTERPGELSREEQDQLRQMRARDREVRAHEQAHKAAAGSLASGAPTYETETGPDGRAYAVGGEVGIRLSEGDSPQETARLARQARRAALAPAQPSSQDRAVAAQAAQMEARARAEATEPDAAEDAVPASQAAATSVVPGSGSSEPESSPAAGSAEERGSRVAGAGLAEREESASDRDATETARASALEAYRGVRAAADRGKDPNAGLARGLLA